MADEIQVCPVCGEPRESVVEFPRPDGTGTFQKRVPVQCRCERETGAAAEEEERRRQFQHRMETRNDKYRLSGGGYDAGTFAADDRREPKLSDTCRRYVERWEEMRAENMGILFYGPVGTGKSFYACAIANALLERCVPALVTNFPRLLNLLQSSRERQEIIDALRKYEMLVIDDLGVERDSPYAMEQVFDIIDERARSRKPLVVTTNLTMEELTKPATMQAKRVYDRILELCPITMKMTGESRRAGNAQRRREQARRLLLDE